MTTVEHRPQLGQPEALRAARRLIFEQHTELRRLLALGLIETCAPSRGQQFAPTALGVLVARIRTAFIQHLADEEAALLPLLDGGVLSVRRTQILREEHARQRRELDEVHALSQRESAAVFADRFDALARSLLIDIAEEERDLALALAARDERTARGCYSARPSTPAARAS